jgi:uncharacterized damage-inducible protein DinB
MSRPTSEEYALFYQTYIDQTTENSIQDLESNHSKYILNCITNIPNEKADYAYAPDKWTIKEVLQHMIDTERIFVYRALSFSRKSQNPIHGFDENEFVITSNAKQRRLESLQSEFAALRNANDIFFTTLTETQLKQKGNANNQNITVNALVYITIGHALHHCKILKERYHASSKDVVF